MPGDLFVPGTLKAIATSGKTGSTCSADIGGQTVTIEVARDLSVASGDGLLVVRSGDTWYAIGRTSTAAPAVPDTPPPPPPPSKPVVVTGKLIVSPVETRSRQGSRWRTDTDDVYQGQYGGNGNHIGCVFYGTKPRTLAGATVTSAYVRIRRLDKGGTNAAQDTTLRLVAERFRPSGAPTLGSVADGPNLRRGETQNGVQITTAWVQAMVDGTAGGLAVYEADGSPYVILAGRGAWSAAWTMTIYWRRG
jgi:hypothetical protein